MVVSKYVKIVSLYETPVVRCNVGLIRPKRIGELILFIIRDKTLKNTIPPTHKIIMNQFIWEKPNSIRMQIYT